MKVAFYTLGCKANQFETQALERLFRARGHELVDFADFADVYIVNTCTVTALADKKSRNAARRCKRLNPACRLILCGCYAQMEPERAKALCGADYVIGTADKAAVMALAEQGGADAVSDLWHGERPVFEQLPAGGLEGRTRALLKIQDGCQSFCTYCLIPFARGPSRSLPFDRAVAEARRLAAEGYRELVLTGIEISEYGLDLPGAPTLTDLIEALCAAAPQLRVRLGSLEPRTATEEFAARCAALPNLCPHFHLSLQSGCDRTLAAMNRRYTAARYAEGCAALRRHFPLCAITTDLIVGFPGETAADFAESLAFVRRCRLSQVHVFPYSRRQGTRAAALPGQLTAAEKEARAQEAIEVCKALQLDFLDSLVGQTLPVLFEQAQDGGFVGHCPQYMEVWAAGAELHNEVRPVRITARADTLLKGEIV